MTLTYIFVWPPTYYLALAKAAESQALFGKDMMKKQSRFFYVRSGNEGRGQVT